MKYSRFAPKCALFLLMILCVAVFSIAQDEGNTEVTGFYQQYRDFSFNTGYSAYDFPATQLSGGGFNVTQNLAPWFAMWTQFSFFGTIDQPGGLSLRVIHNLEGVRWQTREHGPFRLYVKAGLGFANYRFDFGSNTKFSFAYGAGVQVWGAKWLGVTLDLSQVFMGVPNLTDLEGRDKWDSGLTFTPGLSIRF
jgi:opacity protein-like surface antigen